MKKILTIFGNDEFVEVPSHASVDLTPELLERVRQIAHEAARLNAYYVVVPSLVDLTYLEDDDEAAEGFSPSKIDVEMVRLYVSPDSFFWRGYRRHTSSTWSSDVVYLSDLEKEDA